jgi:hypothetical protein
MKRKCSSFEEKTKKLHFFFFFNFPAKSSKKQIYMCFIFMVAVDSMCCHAGSPFRKDKKNLKEMMEIGCSVVKPCAGSILGKGQKNLKERCRFSVMASADGIFFFF